MLFTACLRNVFKALDKEKLGVTFSGVCLCNLRLSDHISLSNNSGDQFVIAIAEFDIESRTVGMKIMCRKILLSYVGREERVAIGGDRMRTMRLK